MNPETKIKFERIIKHLVGDATLPPELSLDDVAASMAKFYESVIAKSELKTGEPVDDELKFFMTFFAGYLCGYRALLKEKTKDNPLKPWVMPKTRDN